MPKLKVDFFKGKKLGGLIPLSVAFLNRDISDPQFVNDLIHPGASYQVIPAPRTPFIYDPEALIITILPKTK